MPEAAAHDHTRQYELCIHDTVFVTVWPLTFWSQTLTHAESLRDWCPRLSVWGCWSFAFIKFLKQDFKIGRLGAILVHFYSCLERVHSQTDRQTDTQSLNTVPTQVHRRPAWAMTHWGCFDKAVSGYSSWTNRSHRTGSIKTNCRIVILYMAYFGKRQSSICCVFMNFFCNPASSFVGCGCGLCVVIS